MPKTKGNISRKMRNKVIPGLRKKDEIILMESGVFPAVYFKKSKFVSIFSDYEECAEGMYLCDKIF